MQPEWQTVKVPGLQVLKFGGASLQNAESFNRLASLIPLHQGPVLVVISAMGKTTNALEKLAALAIQQQGAATHAQLAGISAFHTSVASALLQGKAQAELLEQLEHYLQDLRRIVQGLELLGDFPARISDRIMATGELLSSTMLWAYLSQLRNNVVWVDARRLILTDASYRNAEVVWTDTAQRVQQELVPLLQPGHCVVTQGYIASTQDGRTTTLGREGSDYTAAILASLLGAEKVVVYKDVPGVLTADPRKDAALALPLPRLSYRQAIEMSYYGASVIHPKTLKPLQNHAIPLWVKSFAEPAVPGTLITEEAESQEQPLCCIRKEGQALLTLIPRDFGFMDASLLRPILERISLAGMQLNLLQVSALQLTLCVDYSAEVVEELRAHLVDNFEFGVQQPLRLTTYLASNNLPSPPPNALLIQQLPGCLAVVTA